MSRKPIIWQGDNDMMIPYQGVAMTDKEIELDEAIADEFAASNKARTLTDDEKLASDKYKRYAKRNNIDLPAKVRDGGGDNRANNADNSEGGGE